jgi:hypothetical protein
MGKKVSWLGIHCHLSDAQDTLVIENSRIQRTYLWNGGNVISKSIYDKRSGYEWALWPGSPDLLFPNETAKADKAIIQFEKFDTSPASPPHLKVHIAYALGTLEVKRVFRVYPNVPVIACDYYLRGNAQAGTWLHKKEAAPIRDLEAFGLASDIGMAAPVLERLCFGKPRHLDLSCIRFYDITDRCNRLVVSESSMPYTQPGFLRGNLLLATDVVTGQGFFILKEAPCSNIQLAYPGCDFVCLQNSIMAVGIGVEPDSLEKDAWRRCYGFTTGVAAGHEKSLLGVLRSYQANIRTFQPNRDRMIMLNTWGDRGRDARICESFASAEIQAGQKLGTTHFQLDDGWQKGTSSNSAMPGGTLNNIWTRNDYWDIHPQRFPRGFDRIMTLCKEASIELCLWFNPCSDDSYANWEKDADRLIALNRDYGIRIFKIDGVIVPDKKAEINLRSLFEKVGTATRNAVVFNLDVTASRRFGYHYFNEYGNVFLENRYTDWGNYYPHWTLRNLWMLSRYVPAQNLQIEFLNKWRNPHKYEKDDPLAPINVPFDYCFAVTMMAQPLAWLEASNLPAEAFNIKPCIDAYKAHQAQLQEGQIFPVGELPTGASWTGFQSVNSDRGYLLVFRENNREESHAVELWDGKDQRIECRKIAGHGEDFSGIIDGNGRLKVHLPGPLSFCLHEYKLIKSNSEIT